MIDISVPATNNNCFFNTIATHFLAYNRPLPEGLFQTREDSSPLVKTIQAELDKRFPSLEDKNAFFMSPEYLYEKTFVLGYLFRDYAPTLIAKDLEKNFETYQEQFLDMGGVPDALPVDDQAASASASILSEPEDDVLFVRNHVFNRIQGLAESWNAEHFAQLYMKALRKIEPNVSGLSKLETGVDISPEEAEMMCDKLGLKPLVLLPVGIHVTTRTFEQQSLPINIQLEQGHWHIFFDAEDQSSAQADKIRAIKASYDQIDEDNTARVAALMNNAPPQQLSPGLDVKDVAEITDPILISLIDKIAPKASSSLEASPLAASPLLSSSISGYPKPQMSKSFKIFACLDKVSAGGPLSLMLNATQIQLMSQPEGLPLYSPSGGEYRLMQQGNTLKASLKGKVSLDNEAHCITIANMVDNLLAQNITTIHIKSQDQNFVSLVKAYVKHLNEQDIAITCKIDGQEQDLTSITDEEMEKVRVIFPVAASNPILAERFNLGEDQGLQISP